MQNYTVYLFLENSSTFFGWYFRPSSGENITVFTVSGTYQTVTVNTVMFSPDDGRKYHLKNVEEFSKNK